jgi:DNA repair protein RecO (recombination protein O)
MLHTCRAFVLKTFRHSDKSVVLKAYTAHVGLRTYLVRTGKRGGAALQALNRVEIVADEHGAREMHQVRDIRVQAPFRRIGPDPLRTTVALFVQEILYRVLREEAPDPALFAFIDEALEHLDTAEDVRYFPLLFLLRLSGHLGFLPEAPGPGEDRFDLREGHFIAGGIEHGHTLGPVPSSALAALLPLDLGDVPARPLPPSLRRELLDHLLLYYRLHLEGLGELRSPSVLHQVLG